jgi:mycoredoxin
MENLPSQVIVYGTTWCGDTIRTRSYLDQNHIPYQWIDIDKDIDGRNFVESTNNGHRSVPTLVFSDGSILVEPSSAALAKKLGF